MTLPGRIILLLLWQLPFVCLAQAPDTIPVSRQTNYNNFTADSAIQKARELLLQEKSQAEKALEARINSIRKIPAGLKGIKTDSLLPSFSNPFKNLWNAKPLVRFTGGYASYNFNYRSNVDTPYVESNIAQHNVSGAMNFRIAGIIPLLAMYRVRRSNSGIFRDITDIQVSFNAAEFRNGVQAATRDRLLSMAHTLEDSLAGRLYEIKNHRAANLKSWLQHPFNLQTLMEAHETLRVPRITYKPGLPDSVNRRREDSLKKIAAFFLEQYQKIQQAYEAVNGQADSLRKVYEKSIQTVKRYKELISGQWQNKYSLNHIKNELKELGVAGVEIPAQYRWLAGLRQLSVGRTPVNYTDLTANNISVKGINFEYNSWYYLAATAGLVDYRFRDFAVDRYNQSPQYLYMLRAGIGRLEHNHFILSAYRGRKHLFSGNAGARISSVTVTGFSAETRWQLTRNIYLNGEVATSISPDFHRNPPQASKGFDLSDKTNKAYSIRLTGWWPAIHTRVEGYYKYAGANFQSFSSFQNNAARESWYIRADQQYFKRRLRIVASLRSNEFTNPYVVQQYKSNSVFKSISATLRLPKCPVITVGYLPMSQFTRLDSLLVESRFQTLNASLFHQYKVHGLRAASTFIYNRFYNSNSDTGFVYYNAVNYYLSQTFYFRQFSATASASHTRNSQYELNVLDGGIQLHLAKPGTLGFGVKINSMNRDIVKVGAYVNGTIRMGKHDIIYLSYERGYLPGFSKGLTQNDLATVQFTKYFKSRK